MQAITAHTLHSMPWGESVVRVLQAALEAVDPQAAVARSMRRTSDRLIIEEQAYDLKQFERLLVVGAGKAGMPMAQAVENILGDRLTQGIMIVKEGYAGAGGGALPKKIEIIEAGHPLPDERGLQAARRIAALLDGTTQADLVICLVSGGGSALMVSPAEGVTLCDLQGLTFTMLACGASIDEINALRKHLDTLKGGGLARLAAPARLATLILSDVVGDPLDVIASGPTVPDRSYFSDAYRALQRYHLLEQAPPAIVEHLQRGMSGDVLETPKPGEAIFQGVQNVVIGSNLLAAQAALETARRQGFQTLLLTTYLQGEARQAGRALGAIARQIASTGQPLARPACLAAGGETTVTLSGEGLGGRNQELALGAASDLAGLPDIALVSLATDGGDGPTDAAGAIVTGQTLERARRAGLSPEDHLARNDAYHFFESLGDLLKTGPTRTNVNDLTFIFAF
ncbi:MAG: glycerate kinase [Anaerolineales bacterium]|nr:glycerate kinase [Anaerolineales bacterium]